MTEARILIADDNQAMREIVASLLTADYDVIRAVSDGGLALAAAIDLRPDVVVLDISMPVLDGIEVARRIRKAREHTKVVFLSSDTDLSTVDAAFETGSLGYVFKQRLDADLIPAINLVLNDGRFVSPNIE